MYDLSDGAMHSVPGLSALLIDLTLSVSADRKPSLALLACECTVQMLKHQMQCARKCTLQDLRRSALSTRCSLDMISCKDHRVSSSDICCEEMDDVVKISVKNLLLDSF